MAMPLARGGVAWAGDHRFESAEEAYDILKLLHRTNVAVRDDAFLFTRWALFFVLLEAFDKRHTDTGIHCGFLYLYVSCDM